MKFIRKNFLIMLLLTRGVVLGQTVDHNLLDDFFRSAVDAKRIAGVHGLVVMDGEIVYSKTFGYADIEAGEKLQADAIYRIASMTKIVTCMAALQLWEQGLYDLDDPVHQYLPVFKNVCVFKAGKNKNPEPPYETESPKRPPTIRDLFRHTAGIRTGKIGRKAGLKNWQGTLDGYVEKMASIPFDTHPGTKFQYGYSIDVLGLLIEKWSGLHLDQYFEKFIFDPLNLKDTGFVISDENLHRLANHYHLKDSTLECRETRETSPFRNRAKALSGGGGWSYSYPGLMTSIWDWLVIMEVLRNSGIHQGVRILKSETVCTMCSDHLGDIPGYRAGLGYGLGIGVVVDGTIHGKGASTGTVYWAGGPHNTYFYIDFQKRISAAMMMQSGPFGLDNMMNEFLIRSQKVFGNQ